ncbi:hypothetical protein DVH24_008618 [Malus domestica]|uniref:Uncharacterized protein n=1 Tax=Malus domestica TaxID=3750 RepID=A0A498JK60_MALDO|nr:hypothetical protein DVH24_008618 [Malus domestica]
MDRPKVQHIPEIHLYYGRENMKCHKSFSESSLRSTCETALSSPLSQLILRLNKIKRTKNRRRFDIDA